MDINNPIFNNNNFNNQMNQNSFQGQNNMNPMMNQMGMNPMMNQMGMNQMMNQMGMNPMMNQMGMNPMMNQMGMNPMMNQMLYQMTMSPMGNMANNAENLINNNNQQQNNGNFDQSGNNQQQEDFSPNYITLTFIKNNEGSSQRKVEVQCTLDDKVGEVIKRYRTKADDHNQNEKFIYNAKKLNFDLTVREAGLINESKIFVMVTEGIVGGKK